MEYVEGRACPTQAQRSNSGRGRTSPAVEVLAGEHRAVAGVVKRLDDRGPIERDGVRVDTRVMLVEARQDLRARGTAERGVHVRALEQHALIDEVAVHARHEVTARSRTTPGHRSRAAGCSDAARGRGASTRFAVRLGGDGVPRPGAAAAADQRATHHHDQPPTHDPSPTGRQPVDRPGASGRRGTESTCSCRLRPFRLLPQKRHRAPLADGQRLISVQRATRPMAAKRSTSWSSCPRMVRAPPRVIATGHDFFSTPRISPDGRHLAWLSWDHPRMPWDGTELWVGDLAERRLDVERAPRRWRRDGVDLPAGVEPDGVLHFVSDRTGWWNLYRVDGEATVPLAPMEAEFGTPQWVFGMCDVRLPGRRAHRLHRIRSDGVRSSRRCSRPAQRRSQTLDLPYTAIRQLLRSQRRHAACSSALRPRMPRRSSAWISTTRRARGARPQRRATTVDAGLRVRPAGRSRFRPRADSDGVCAVLPARATATTSAPSGERPPLIVESHGGPTSHDQAAAQPGDPVLDQPRLRRGRRQLRRQQRLRPAVPRAAATARWGIVDTEDCINAARYLAEQGEVDGQRLAIRGGSAGGYTTLCALVFHDDFAAGASYFGVADLRGAGDRHAQVRVALPRRPDRAVSRAARDVYCERSPIHFADRLSCPVILFQGLEDRVVPPAQAEAMVDALRAKRRAVRVSGVRRRAARIPQSGDDPAHARGRAVLLFARVRLPARRSRSSRSRSRTCRRSGQPSAVSGQRQRHPSASVLASLSS